MTIRERIYIFIIGMLFANALLSVALFTGALARPAWIVPGSAMVVSKDFITAVQEKQK